MCVTVAKTRLLTPSLAECELQVDPHGVLPVSKRQHIGHVNKFARVLAFFFCVCRIISQARRNLNEKIICGGWWWSLEKKSLFCLITMIKYKDAVLNVKFRECFMVEPKHRISHFSKLNDSSPHRRHAFFFRLSSLITRRVTLNLANPRNKIKNHREEHGNFQSYTDDRSITRDFHTDPDFGYKTKPESLTIFSFIFRLTRS
jgi:hypothetical protein